MSVVQTCRRHKIDPFEYIKDVLTRLPGTPTSQIDQFLPDRWKALQHPLNKPIPHFRLCSVQTEAPGSTFHGALLLHAFQHAVAGTVTHDLRRTFLTSAEKLGLPYVVLKKLANHSCRSDTTFGYLIVDVERLREPMQKITDHLLSLMSGSR